MFIASEVLLLGLPHHFAKELAGHIAIQQPIPILGEHGHVPNGLVQIHPHEPPEKHAVVDLLHQQSFTADRVQHLDQLRPEQLLRRYRRPTRLGVHFIESRRHAPQRQIRHSSNCPQRVIGPHPLFGRQIAEHVRLLMVLTAHTT